MLEEVPPRFSRHYLLDQKNRFFTNIFSFRGFFLLRVFLKMPTFTSVESEDGEYRRL